MYHFFLCKFAITFENIDIYGRRIEETMKRQGYDAQDIANAINKATFEIPEKPLEEPTFTGVPNDPYVASPQEDYFAQINGSDDDFADDLTEENKIYLRLKWGKAYKPEEWVRLEQLYEEMMASYDIQGAGHIDTLKLVCKHTFEFMITFFLQYCKGKFTM